MRPFPCLLFLALTICRQAIGDDRGLRLNIHVYDYSGRQASVLPDVQVSVAEVFRQAGIGIHWDDCLFGVKRATVSVCGSGTLDVTHLVLTILPETMAAKIASRTEQLAASVSAPGGFPTQTYIFMDRVTNFSIAAKAPTANMLAMAIAHEIGHLLLGPESHSALGIMRSKWSMDDAGRFVKGFLTFTARQAEAMRAEVWRRMTNS